LTLRARAWFTASATSGSRPAIQTLTTLLDDGARVLWVAAHPDDECFSAGTLAYASLRCKNPLHMLVLTRGEGGEFPKALQDGRALGDIREAEMTEVARRYGAGMEMERYFNASLPTSSFPMRHELAARWAERSDPVGRVAQTIRRFRPDVLMTFPPEYGATGHPEHQLASRFATAGVRLAAAEDAPVEGAPHRIAHTYYMLHRYKALRFVGMALDPRLANEQFDARAPCVDGMTSIRKMAELTRPHQTQKNDMRMIRLFSRFMRVGHLYKADPFTEIHDPYEHHPIRGMG
jgi:LmbE family N-acetylglucosaminyl deacetylase